MPLHNVDIPFEKACFGMGCFWSNDSLFGATKGVLRTRVGYAGGKLPNPTYKKILDHTEVIEIDYDPLEISYNGLLDLFWKNHEYAITAKIKTQYQSLILYYDEAQKEKAEASKLEQQNMCKDGLITTRIDKLTTFYPAEDYHQKYRLQGHKYLMKQLKITPQLLQTSFLAARLNGYLVGVGGLNQFEDEIKILGLTQEQIDYVKEHLKKNEGGNLHC